MSSPTRLYSASGTVPAGAPATPSAPWTDWGLQHVDVLLSRTVVVWASSPETGYNTFNQGAANGTKKCVKRGFYQLTNGHTFDGETVKGVIKGEYNSYGQTTYDGNIFCTLSIRLFSSDFATERTAPLALTKDNVAASAGYISRVHPTASTALASVTAQANDWLVVEWGIEQDCVEQAEAGYLSFAGGNSTTTPATEADGTNDGQAWIEFSGDLDVGGGTALAAGTATLGSITVTTVNATATAPTGGTAPYYYQWQRRLSPSGGWVNVPGSTSTTLADSTF